MKEQLISFECAKLAKEKGVNERNEKGVAINHDLWLYCEHCYDPEQPKELQTWDENINCSTDERLDRLIHAPTQSLLQKWLREEKGIVVIVCYRGTDWEVDIKLNDKRDTKYTFYEKNDFSFKDYEEALEEGLKEGLKLC